MRMMIPNDKFAVSHFNLSKSSTFIEKKPKKKYDKFVKSDIILD